MQGCLSFGFSYKPFIAIYTKNYGFFTYGCCLIYNLYSFICLWFSYKPFIAIYTKNYGFLHVVDVLYITLTGFICFLYDLYIYLPFINICWDIQLGYIYIRFMWRRGCYSWQEILGSEIVD